MGINNRKKTVLFLAFGKVTFGERHTLSLKRVSNFEYLR